MIMVMGLGLGLGLGAAWSARALETPAAAPAPAVTTGAQVDDSGPSVLIESAARAMLAELDAHRGEYRQNPARVDALVDRILLPYFDTDYAARLVLARHWTTASAEQRRRFVAAFYHSLLSNYGTALVDFSGERLKVLPFTGDAAATTATIRTQVRKNDGTNVAVNYSLHRTVQGWRAWDVIIEGISYVKSFRDDFNAQIQQQGVDALIARLEQQSARK
ncbi:MAG: ABC transporter substrate-binding protein [Steroidobacteraceae bacterium]